MSTLKASMMPNSGVIDAPWFLSVCRTASRQPGFVIRMTCCLVTPAATAAFTALSTFWDPGRTAALTFADSRPSSNDAMRAEVLGSIRPGLEQPVRQLETLWTQSYKHHIFCYLH